MPYLLTKLPLKEFGFLLSAIYFLAVLPIYFAAAALVYKNNTKFVCVLPIINALFFCLVSILFFNSGITAYLAIYVPMSYIAIVIKYFSQTNQ